MAEHQKEKKRNGQGMDRRTFLKASGIATGALLGGFHFVRKAQAQRTGPIKLGFITPLTGPYATEAKDMQAGAELAIAQINAAGGARKEG